MSDLLWLTLCAAMFAATILLAAGCASLQKGK